MAAGEEGGSMCRAGAAALLDIQHTFGGSFCSRKGKKKTKKKTKKKIREKGKTTATKNGTMQYAAILLREKGEYDMRRYLL
jgi:hypothetical protein